MTNLDSILKSRDITLPTKVHIVKAMVFPVVMYGCESWTTKKAEGQRTDAFELWCWRRLRVPWASGRSNQSILKKIIPEYSLEGLTLKLKLQYFGHLMRRADSSEKTLMLGKIEGKRRKLDSITDWMNMNVSKLQQTVKDREAWHVAVHGVANCGTGLSDWAVTTVFVCAQLLSHAWLSVTLWSVACQTSLSLEFSRHEYWSGLPCSSPGVFPFQGWNPPPLHCRQILLTPGPLGKLSNNNNLLTRWFASPSTLRRSKQISSREAGKLFQSWKLPHRKEKEWLFPQMLLRKSEKRV